MHRPGNIITFAKHVAVAMLLAGTTCPIQMASAQWLQWGGPNRNFTVESGALADTWPKGGPPVLWKRKLGDGYSTILVDKDRLYTMYRKRQVEWVVCLDARTGATIWERDAPSPTTSLMDEFGAGPHATPLIVDDKLFTIGTNMLLRCFSKRDGTILWEHDLPQEYDAVVPAYGYSSSPIAYEDLLILPVGGRSNQSLVSFEQDNGKIVWASQTFEICHGSPIIVQFDGAPQLIYPTRIRLIALDPDSGRLLWRHTFNSGVNAMTPVWDGDDKLFYSAAYGYGSAAMKLIGDQTTPNLQRLWFTKRMRIHHGNAIWIDDHIYGSSGYGTGPVFLSCLDARTGEIVWRERGFKKATLLRANGKLIILLALAKPTLSGLNVLTRHSVAEPYSWAAPTLVGTTLYVRDRKHIMALDLGVSRSDSPAAPRDD